MRPTLNLTNPSISFLKSRGFPFLPEMTPGFTAGLLSPTEAATPSPAIHA